MSGGPRAFVIGHPIGHSRSPLIHGHWLGELGIAGSYERIDVAPDELPAFIARLRQGSHRGGNVTLPHKEAALRLVDEVSPEALRLGAVNTLVVSDEGRLIGRNTDGAGFAASLDEAAPGWDGRVRRALVMGAGGAARAIVGALVERGVAGVTVANRSAARAEPLQLFAPSLVATIGWTEIGAHLPSVDLLINATTLGMAGQPDLDIRLDALPPTAIVTDIVYVPIVTPLLAAARARGLATVDGLGMLLHQAAPGFAAWFGPTPKVSPALRALVEADIRAA